MSSSVRHVGLVVRDLAQLQDFYQTVFGLRLADHAVEEGTFIESLTGVPAACLEWVKLEGSNGVVVELLHYHSEETPLRHPARTVQQGTIHIAFTVQNAAKTAERIQNMGGSAAVPLKNPQGTVLVLYAQDPEGNQLEIVEPLSPCQPECKTLRGLCAEQCMDYENGFYWFSDPSRVGKLLAQYELYRKIEHISGAVVETGVFKGSTLLRLATFCKLLGNNDRSIFAFDMFSAFPQECALESEVWYAKSYDANYGLGLSVEEIHAVLEKKGLNTNVTLVAGDICRTLPGYFADKELAFVHVDVELYAPTKVIIEECWPRLAPGGVMVFDDYDEATNSKMAIDEFVRSHGVCLEKLSFIDTPVFCIKGKG